MKTSEGKLPHQFETERLLLRAPGPADAPGIFEGVRESLAELQPWMIWATSSYSQEDAEGFVQRGLAHWQTQAELPMLVFEKSSSQFIGSSGFHNVNWAVPRLEIGYWLRTSAWGKGYMTEAVLGLKQYGFENTEAVRLEIRCDSTNRRSIRVAERAGFHLEGTHVNDSRSPAGEIRSTSIYAVTRNQID